MLQESFQRHETSTNLISWQIYSRFADQHNKDLLGNNICKLQELLLERSHPILSGDPMARVVLLPIQLDSRHPSMVLYLFPRAEAPWGPFRSLLGARGPVPSYRSIGALVTGRPCLICKRGIDTHGACLLHVGHGQVLANRLW